MPLEIPILRSILGAAARSASASRAPQELCAGRAAPNNSRHIVCEAPWRRGDAGLVGRALQLRMCHFRSDISACKNIGPVCCRTPQALLFSPKTIIVGFPIEIGPAKCHLKSPFCDRFWARPRCRRRARAGGRTSPRLARRLVSLRILCESLRGVGETLRRPDAPCSSNCVKSGRNYLGMVLFAVDLHRRCFFLPKPL